MAVTTIPFKGDYIQGKFVLPTRVDGEWTKHSPSDLKDKVIEITFGHEHVEAAVQAAQKAYKAWSHLSFAERSAHLKRLQEMYLAHAEAMAEVIARETGKPLWEAKTEAANLSNKISITLDHSAKLIADEKVENALPNINGFIRHKSRGVMAVIGPFNFPAHLPNGHIIPALYMGNTVVFKPSDKTPGVGQLMAEIIHKAQLPPGVFNLVQGDAQTGRKLVAHELVDGVLFTGSYEVGLKIKEETLRHHWKILALEMGGKNCGIVWKDCDIEKAVYENLVGGFLTSGQRCSATSKILVHPEVKDEFVDKFYQAAKKIKIGHWSENPFMGPLISKESVDNFLRFQDIAKRENAESLMRGKALERAPNGYYVSPSINLLSGHDPKSVYQHSEIFGPNVAILGCDEIDKAIDIVNSSGFGLVCSIYTKSSEIYKRVFEDTIVGLVNWNRTTNGASSKLPFGGIRKSGNDRASGHLAIQYCSVPVGCLEDMTELQQSHVMPGMDFEVTKK